MMSEHAQVLNEEVFSIDQYHLCSPGSQSVSMFIDMAGLREKTFKGSILDVGTGSGKGAAALADAGFVPVHACDLQDYRKDEAKDHRVTFHEANLLNDLRPLGWFDYVYCCDVLEHLEEAFTMLAVMRMLAIARKGVFLAIPFTADVFGYQVGRPLHLTVKGFVWWRDRLREVSHGQLRECRDQVDRGMFWITPRCSTPAR